MIRSYKNDIDYFVPKYYKWSFAVVQLVEAFANLFLTPFGYEFCILLEYISWVMDRLPETTE